MNGALQAEAGIFGLKTVGLKVSQKREQISPIGDLRNLPIGDPVSSVNDPCGGCHLVIPHVGCPHGVKAGLQGTINIRLYIIPYLYGLFRTNLKAMDELFKDQRVGLSISEFTGDKYRFKIGIKTQ